MRSIKELLELLLIRLIIVQYNGTYKGRVIGVGLCYVISDMYYEEVISVGEKSLLLAFVKTNAVPKWYMLRFYCNDGLFAHINYKEFAYFWKPGKFKPRIKWVKRQINKL